jgi:branched-chain amino acid transport system permease protein
VLVNVVAQAIEGTLVMGSIYGLVGVGFVLLFRSSKVLSFTQGGFVLLGAFVFYDLVQNGSQPFALAMVLTVLAVALFSAALYVVVFARVAAREHFTTSVATIGLAGVLTAVVAVRYGTAPLSLPEDVVSARAFQVLGAVVSVVDIVAVVIAAVVMAILIVMLRFTPIGLRMNAVADNVSLSSHLGIDAVRVATVAWALAGAAAALAGIAFSLKFSVDPVGVANVGFLAFPAIILGGLDSIGGALVGGLLIAGTQNLVQLTLGAQWVNIVSFALMLAILLVRPSGLFGRAEVVRL